ncbi:MAG: alpha-amylase [Syntrophus sp. (in: bacteria)]|nr:alpha-amylase [Syntrophus sp. (in: bacteria)]
MTTRCAHPVIYEINTWVWLGEMSRRYGKTITLDAVPVQEWDALADLGIDALWLMGVWERSPAGIRIASQNEGLVADFKGTLSDFSPEDNVGSPYCVRNYTVDAHLGGPEGLSEARRMLAERDIELILDFIPNHVAPDHSWVMEHPEYFIRGNEEEFSKDPGSFMQIDNRVFACGRDPHYPAWPDVLQLNAFHPEARRAIIDMVLNIAGQCDGVRCDMAMLVMNPVFSGTWGTRAGSEPEQEFWPELIRAVRKSHPSFLFLAEAYWGLEWRLQQQGFDFCYDKRLYDRLKHDNAESVRLHLCAERSYQDKLIRFIENHDEPRAAIAFSSEKAFAAAVTIATIPGARLFHEGQFEGRIIRLPVFLGRRPEESGDPHIQAFYRTLLSIMKSDCLRNGEWRLCERIVSPDPAGNEKLVGWFWRNKKESCLIVVNLSDAPAQGQVRLPGNDPTGESCLWTDIFTGNVCEIRSGGLSVDLPAWGFHILK